MLHIITGKDGFIVIAFLLSLKCQQLMKKAEKEVIRLLYHLLWNIYVGENNLSNAFIILCVVALKFQLSVNCAAIDVIAHWELKYNQDLHVIGNYDLNYCCISNHEQVSRQYDGAYAKSLYYFCRCYVMLCQVIG